MYQIILKNGLIWDSATSSAIQKDLSIENGKIACIGPIHENEQTIGRLTNVIDVSGAMVLPGLIDMHTHIYPLAAFGTSAEASCFSSGVTAALDCGSAGAANYEKRSSLHL